MIGAQFVPAGAVVPASQARFVAHAVRKLAKEMRAAAVPVSQYTDLLAVLDQAAAFHQAGQAEAAAASPRPVAVPPGIRDLVPPRSTPTSSRDGDDAPRGSDNYLSPRQVAEALGVSREAVTKRCRRETIAGAVQDTAGHWRIPQAFLEQAPTDHRAAS